MFSRKFQQRCRPFIKHGGFLLIIDLFSDSLCILLIFTLKAVLVRISWEADADTEFREQEIYW